MENIYAAQRDFWESAVNTRRSVRSYQRRAVPDDILQFLLDYKNAMHIPFEHTVDIREFKSVEGRQLANNLRKPPEDNLAFIADTDLLSFGDVGFVGELIILFATGLGLSTCWFGHYISREVNALVPDIADDEAPAHGMGARENIGRRVVCITPLGYWEQGGLRPVDRLTARMMSFKRKPIGERLIGGLTERELQPEIAFALDMARKAPSAANTQHWEFDVSRDQRRGTIAKPKGYKHMKWEHPDVCAGCCAAHFWLGLQLQGIQCSVNREAREGRVLWEFAF